MKILKIIGLSILGLVILGFAFSLFLSTEFRHEQSTTINAPIEAVWENTNSLADLDAWSPWTEKDPNMKKSMTGTDGTLGAMSSWESDVDEVGVGSQTITKIEAPNRFNTDLKFYTPYESEAKAYVILTKNGNQTDVTWGFESDMPRPFNLMKLLPSMNEMMEVEFNTGLKNLKRICEQ